MRLVTELKYAALAFGACTVAMLVPTAAAEAVTSAAAAEGVSVAVTPSTALPDDTINVLSTCQNGEVQSDVFPTTSLSSVVGNGTYRSGATVTISSTAAAGTYAVQVQCSENANIGTTTLVVMKRRGVHTGDGVMAGGTNWILLGGGVGLLALACAGGLRGRRQTVRVE